MQTMARRPDGQGVTVVLPVHNGERFVRRAVGSVLAQTYQHVRLLVVDDGSTDATPTILDEVRDPRMSVIRLDPRQGVTAALQAAIGQVVTPFVARVDADDEALPAWLDASVAHLVAEPTVDVMSCGSQPVDVEGRPIGEPIVNPADHDRIAVGLLVAPCLAHGGTVARTDVIRTIGYRASLHGAEDYHLWADALLAGHRFANLTGIHYLYRQHPGQWTRTERPQTDRAHRAVQVHLVEHLWPEAPASMRRDIARWLWMCHLTTSGRRAGRPDIDLGLHVTRYLVEHPVSVLPIAGVQGMRRHLITRDLVARGATPRPRGLRDAWGDLSPRERVPIVARVVRSRLRALCSRGPGPQS